MKEEGAVSKWGVGAQMPTGHLECDTSQNLFLMSAFYLPATKAQKQKG